MTFQCDKHSEHVICNDCIEDQTCPYCNAPVLERYVMIKIKDNVPILKNSAYIFRLFQFVTVRHHDFS